MASRDPITCHVLDTTAGCPAANISATLSCNNSSAVFTAVTNTDGRITNWKSEGSQATIASLIKDNSEEQKAAHGFAPKGSSVWRIKFNTGAYYGSGNTFFPEVEVAFFVKVGEHFHVPLLLSPYSYTTYRGS
jgi:5-hydroxyisourate hydrolase